MKNYPAYKDLKSLLQGARLQQIIALILLQKSSVFISPLPVSLKGTIGLLFNRIFEANWSALLQKKKRATRYQQPCLNRSKSIY